MTLVVMEVAVMEVAVRDKNCLGDIARELSPLWFVKWKLNIVLNSSC